MIYSLQRCGIIFITSGPVTPVTFRRWRQRAAEQLLDAGPRGVVVVLEGSGDRRDALLQRAVDAAGDRTVWIVRDGSPDMVVPFLACVWPCLVPVLPSSTEDEDFKAAARIVARGSGDWRWLNAAAGARRRARELASLLLQSPAAEVNRR